MTIAAALIAGCTFNINTDTSESTEETEKTSASEESSDTSVEETTSTTPSWTEDTSVIHEAQVFILSETTVSDAYGDYITRIPDIVVDGESQEDINSSLFQYISQNHTLEYDEEMHMYEGESVDFVWGTNGHYLTVILIAKGVREEYTEYEVLNYNLDTMESANNTELVKSFGYTDESYYNYVGRAYTNWWASESWLAGSEDMRDQSIDEISESTVSACILPSGNLGAVGYVHVPAQVEHPQECFDLFTGIVYFD